MKKCNEWNSTNFGQRWKQRYSMLCGYVLVFSIEELSIININFHTRRCNSIGYDWMFRTKRRQGGRGRRRRRLGWIIKGRLKVNKRIWIFRVRLNFRRWRKGGCFCCAVDNDNSVFRGWVVALNNSLDPVLALANLDELAPAVLRNVEAFWLENVVLTCSF